MSTGRLCTLLGELGYEGWEALDPDSFEWPFQYEDTRPLLNWICSNLRTSNVLSLSELSQYEQFKQEGKLLELGLFPGRGGGSSPSPCPCQEYLHFRECPYARFCIQHAFYSPCLRCGLCLSFFLKPKKEKFWIVI